MDKLITDEYIKKLSENQGKPYTAGKTGDDRYYADPPPVHPPNDGFDGDTWTETLLPKVRVSRYGGSNGRYFSPESVEFEERSLSRDTNKNDYHVYEVIKPLEVKAGKVLPWFGEKGGGTQYTTVGKNKNGEKLKIRDLKGKLEEIK